MECLFCHDDNKYCSSDDEHDSKACEKYVTDKARKKIADKKGFCRFCFVKPENLPNIKKCKSEKICRNSFSTEHHNLFCFERMKALKDFFLPKIDQQLFPRFFQIIDIDEKYSMIISSPDNFKIFPMKPLKIMDDFNEDLFLKHSKSNTIILNRLVQISEHNKKNSLVKLLNSIKSKAVICLTKVVKIEDTKLAGELVLELLSPYTVEFEMSDSSCTSNISFTEIIKKAPNLQSIQIYDSDSNITYEKTWIEDFVKYKVGKNFSSLIIKLNFVEFDVENFVEFVKTKCGREADLQIMFNQDLLDEDEDWSMLAEITTKLNIYFEEETRGEKSLRIGYYGVDGYTDYSLDKIKTPKRAFDKIMAPKRVMPQRSATKRKYV